MSPTEVLTAQPLTMDWSCRALFLVAVTTDKELSSPQVQGDQGQSRGISTHSFLLSTVVHSQMHLELSRAEVRRPEASVNISGRILDTPSSGTGCTGCESPQDQGLSGWGESP